MLNEGAVSSKNLPRFLLLFSFFQVFYTLSSATVSALEPTFTSIKRWRLGRTC